MLNNFSPNNISFFGAFVILRGDKILDLLMRSSSDSLSDTEILFLNCSTRDRIAIWFGVGRVGNAGAGLRDLRGSI